MTLIASTLNYKVPFMISDLLISSDGVESSVQLPTNTIDINQFLKPKTSYAIGLYQKLYIVRENVCVALAGDVYEMRIFLEEMIQRCKYFDTVEENHIREFIEGYDLQKNFSNAAFFIMLINHIGETSIEVKQFWYPPEKWGYVQSDIFEAAYACGSGKEDFLYQIKEKANFEATTEKGNIQRAVAANIGFISKLLAVERVSLNTINKGWGGGYEIVFYNGHEFQKFDQMAYIVNHGQFNQEGDIGLPFPQLILHYRNYNDLLLISSIEIMRATRKDEDDIITITSTDYNANLHIVPRIDRKTEFSKNELPSDFSFETNCIAMGYALITKSNSIFSPSFFAESKDLKVTYKDNEKIEIVLNHKINDLIRNGAKNVFPKL